MPDTIRTRSELVALLTDNSSGEISAQDLRDLLASVYTRDDVDLPPGPQGPQGLQGLQGLQGPAGANGTNGTNGTNGIDGQPGIPFKIAAGRWFTNSPDTTTLTTVAGAANRIDIAPWLCPFTTTVDQMGALCSTGVASALAKIVCYASDADGRPAGLLFETGNLDCATAAFKPIAQAFTFTKGVLYWLGVRHSSTATLNGHQMYCSPSLSFGATPTSSVNKLLRRTVTFATPAPNPWVYNAAEETATVVSAVFGRAA